MDNEKVKFALEMLDWNRIDYGCNSIAYIECVEFFESLYNYNRKEMERYKQVLYNPVTKKHELV